MTTHRDRSPHTPPGPPARVGYVIKMFPRLSETFILNEILELEEQGLDLHIFSLRKPVDAVRHVQTKSVRATVTYLPEKFHQAPLRMAQGQWHVWRHYPRTWRHSLRGALHRVRSAGDSGNLMAFYQACCLIRQMGGIRHLHAHYANLPAKVALLVHRVTGLAYSITTHAKDIFQNDPFALPRLRERMARARFVIANSRFSADHIRAGLNGEGEIHVVHNGVDLESFPLRQDAPKRPLLLSVGRLVEKKGFEHLVGACNLLKQRGMEFSCEIVGTGLLSSRLKDLIRQYGVGDRVRLLGPLPQQVLREHYRRAMVFALPCVRAKDGDRDILPNAVKEAMAVGVPVVTTRLEGIQELVEDGVSGLLIQPGNQESLAAKLEELLQNPQLRQRLSVAGRKVIETRFDRRRNFVKLRELFEAPLPARSVKPVGVAGTVYQMA